MSKCKIVILYCSPCYIYLEDYPWRTAAQPLTSNVIKWFYMPDFAMRPNPSFIFCKFIVLFLPLLLFSFVLHVQCSSSDQCLSLSLQTTTSFCSAHLCSGRCLWRRTEQRCDCLLATTLRSAVVWILALSTSSYLLTTSFTAGQKYQTWCLGIFMFFFCHLLYFIINKEYL